MWVYTRLKNCFVAHIPTSRAPAISFNRVPLPPPPLPPSSLPSSPLPSPRPAAILLLPPLRLPPYGLYAGSYTADEPKGVCPDTLLPGGQDQVRLIHSERSGNINFVAWSRKILPAGPWDRALKLGERAYVWAYGPLSLPSTVERAIVLYHTDSQHSGSSFKLDLSEDMYDCDVPMGMVELPQNCGPEVIDGDTTFTITTGPNQNYPNPPAWGLSYHINGKESPIIKVVRGRKYTFSIQAAADHPFYITTDINGGRSKASETVFVGGAEAHGAAAAPYVLKWTPDNNTPDMVYYQCWIHQKLGWRIEVSGSFAGVGESSGEVGMGSASDGVFLALIASSPAIHAVLFIPSTLRDL